MVLTCILGVAVVFPEVVASEMRQSMALPVEGIQVRLDAGKKVVRREQPRVNLSLHPRLSVGRVESSAQPVGQTDLGKACTPMPRSERGTRNQD